MLTEIERKLAYQKRSDAIHKKRFNTLVSAITKEELLETYEKNDIIATARYFHTSEENIYRLLEYYSIAKHGDSRLFINKLKEKISKEKLEDVYYKTKSDQHTCKELGIKLSGLKKLLKAYNIPLISRSDKHSFTMIKHHKARIETTDNIKLLQELYEIKRYPLYQICRELHMSAPTVKRLIKQNSFSRPVSLYPSNSNSVPNLSFAKLLDDNGIKYEREFRLYNPRSGSNYKHYQYDFKVDKYLIEINPSVTHNITRGPRGGHSTIIDPMYHKKKSNFAYEHGYVCINVWDWSDRNKIIEFLKSDLVINLQFGEPRRYIFDLKNNKLLDKIDTMLPDYLIIYDEGSIGLPSFNKE